MSNKACIGFAWVKDRGEALKTAMAYVESRMIPAKVQKDLEDCFYQIPSVRARYYCDKNVPYSQRNMQMENLADMANRYWLKAMFTYCFLYWEQYQLLGIVMMPQKEVCEKWPLCAFFQDNHNHTFNKWESGNIPFFMDAIAKAKTITPDNAKENMDCFQHSRCYEYIYKTLGLDSWMLGHNENAPYESFSLCGVTDEMGLFQYITLLKALINDRREGIVTQTGKKEKEQ